MCKLTEQSITRYVLFCGKNRIIGLSVISINLKRYLLKKKKSWHRIFIHYNNFFSMSLIFNNFQIILNKILKFKQNYLF